MIDLQKVVDKYPKSTIFIATHYQAMNALAMQLSGGLQDFSDQPATSLPAIDIDNCDLLLIELENGNPASKAKVKMHIKTSN